MSEESIDRGTQDAVLTEQDHVQRIVSRLRRDETALSTHGAELRAMIEGAIEALKGRDFPRLSGYVENLSDWLAVDYRERSVLCDTIQMLYYFIGAFGVIDDPTEDGVES